MQGANVLRESRLWLVIAAAALVSGCFFFAGDPDLAQPDEAEMLTQGTPLMNRLECDDDGDGDCNDWYRISVTTPGSLEVVVSTVAGKGSAEKLVITLADAEQLTLIETPSGGRARFGLRWDVKPGTYYLWMRADGDTKGELRYQLTGSISETSASGGAGGGGGGGSLDPTTPRLCLRIEASPRLNFFSGQPHVVRLLLFPLESSLAFEQADPDGLLRGEQPAGLVGAAIQVKLVPGEKRELGDPLPASVRTIGVVADFYRAPGAQEGRRKAAVAVNCAQGSTRVPLGENGIELE